MRLFVAVDVGDETRAQLRAVRGQLEAVMAQAATPPRVTWVSEERAHVTIRFIGQVTPESAAAVEKALSEPLDVPALEVEWHGVGVFPGNRAPRVVWIGCAAGADQLAAVAERVNERVAPIVGPGEERPFRAHLTLARVKDPGRRFDWRGSIAAIDSGSTRTHVDHATLYRSHLSPKGPTYTQLVRTPLAG